MMKAKARFYKGIEFIQITELPADQQVLLQSSPYKPERIKILVDGKIVENCIQFAHYGEWYQEIFENSVAPEVPVNQNESASVPQPLAISKS